MAEFLSDAWIAELDAAARAADDLDADPPFVVATGGARERRRRRPLPGALRRRRGVGGAAGRRRPPTWSWSPTAPPPGPCTRDRCAPRTRSPGAHSRCGGGPSCSPHAGELLAALERALAPLRAGTTLRRRPVGWAWCSRSNDSGPSPATAATTGSWSPRPPTAWASSTTIPRRSSSPAVDCSTTTPSARRCGGCAPGCWRRPIRRKRRGTPRRSCATTTPPTASPRSFRSPPTIPSRCSAGPS